MTKNITLNERKINSKPTVRNPGGTQQSFIHLFIYTIFERKGTHFVYLLLTNSNPFHILILELDVIPLTAVIT